MTRRPKSNDGIDKKSAIMLTISFLICTVACCYILYYLYIVVVSGDTIQSSVLTRFSEFMSAVLQLIVDAKG